MVLIFPLLKVSENMKIDKGYKVNLSLTRYYISDNYDTENTIEIWNKKFKVMSKAKVYYDILLNLINNIKYIS